MSAFLHLIHESRSTATKPKVRKEKMRTKLLGTCQLVFLQQEQEAILHFFLPVSLISSQNKLSWSFVFGKFSLLDSISHNCLHQQQPQVFVKLLKSPLPVCCTTHTQHYVLKKSINHTGNTFEFGGLLWIFFRLGLPERIFYSHVFGVQRHFQKQNMIIQRGR